jgi:hypothetical protein
VPGMCRRVGGRLLDVLRMVGWCEGWLGADRSGAKGP